MALLEVPEGRGAQVLAAAGVTRADVETHVLALIKPGSGPESGKLPFTPRAKAVVRGAVEEALRLGHDDVGTEHLLLGLLADGESVAAKVLSELGATEADIRARTDDAMRTYGAR